MRLSERLEAARQPRPDAAAPASAPPPQATTPPPVASTTPAAAISSPPAPARAIDHTPARAATPSLASRGRPVVAPVNDALTRLKDSAVEALYERLGTRLSDPNMSEETLSRLVLAELNTVVEASKVPLTASERQRLISEVMDDVLGLGPLEPMLKDHEITEIMVNGPDSVYVERAGRITKSTARFEDEDHLRRVIERIVSKVGRRIDEASPLVDARLADGSRVNAIIPPLAVSGSTLTIRKFSRDALTTDDLIALGSMSPEMAELLRACVLARLNIIISGGTGTGKTTLLNVLSSFIPADERIITIEDSVELQLQQDHVVRLESRPANIEGRGEVTIRELVRNSLRMRPDRIVVGEVRGGESLDMLQAMNTGHDGSLSTVHANSPRDAIARLETLVLMAGMDLPLRAIREQVSAAIDVIVHLTRLRDGTRRVTAVTEVHGMEGQTVTLQDVFTFDYSAGVDSSGRFLGKTQPTGVRPMFTDRFAELGIPISPRVFGSPEMWGTRR